MPVDIGAFNLCINEIIQEQLDLPFLEGRKPQLANGPVEKFNLVGPEVVKFKDRRTVVMLWYCKGTVSRYQGAIPFEYMDSISHPKRQE